MVASASTPCSRRRKASARAVSGAAGSRRTSTVVASATGTRGHPYRRGPGDGVIVRRDRAAVDRCRDRRVDGRQLDPERAIGRLAGEAARRGSDGDGHELPGAGAGELGSGAQAALVVPAHAVVLVERRSAGLAVRAGPAAHHQRGQRSGGHAQRERLHRDRHAAPGIERELVDVGAHHRLAVTVLALAGEQVEPGAGREPHRTVRHPSRSGPGRADRGDEEVIAEQVLGRVVVGALVARPVEVHRPDQRPGGGRARRDARVDVGEETRAQLEARAHRVGGEAVVEPRPLVGERVHPERRAHRPELHPAGVDLGIERYVERSAEAADVVRPEEAAGVPGGAGERDLEGEGAEVWSRRHRRSGSDGGGRPIRPSGRGSRRGIPPLPVSSL